MERDAGMRARSASKGVPQPLLMLRAQRVAALMAALSMLPRPPPAGCRCGSTVCGTSARSFHVLRRAPGASGSIAACAPCRSGPAATSPAATGCPHQSRLLPLASSKFTGLFMEALLSKKSIEHPLMYELPQQRPATRNTFRWPRGFDGDDSRRTGELCDRWGQECARAADSSSRSVLARRGVEPLWTA